MAITLPTIIVRTSSQALPNKELIQKMEAECKKLPTGMLHSLRELLLTVLQGMLDTAVSLTCGVFAICTFCHDFFFTSIREFYFYVSIAWFSSLLRLFSKWLLEHFLSKYLLKCLLAIWFPCIFSVSMNVLIRNVNRNERQFAKCVDISSIVE